MEMYNSHWKRLSWRQEVSLKNIAETNKCMFVMKFNPVPVEIVGVKKYLLFLFTRLG